jgi:hypothetical protein
MSARIAAIMNSSASLGKQQIPSLETNYNEVVELLQLSVTSFYILTSQLTVENNCTVRKRQ